MRRGIWLLTIAPGWVLGACGSADTAGQPPSGPSTLLATIAPEESVVGPAPSTTSPEPVQPLDCSEDPLTIAERTLVARRQGDRSPGCSALLEEDVPAPACWTSCADGTTFVDFSLDPSLLAPSLSEAHGAGGVEVDYVAVYRAEDGALERRAETLLLGGVDGRWTVDELRPVDLGAEIESAVAVADRYLTALAAGDYAAAARLLGAGRPDRPGGRDDLDRLVDDGLLDATDLEAGDPVALAEALARWCRQAACRLPDAVRSEINADHRVRVVASYDADLGNLDVRLDAGTVGTEPFVAGLPPVLP